MLEQLMGNGLSEILTTAVVVNFTTLGCAFGLNAVIKAINKSPIPLNFHEDSKPTVFTVVCSICLSTLFAFRNQKINEIIWLWFAIDIVKVWLSSQVTWKLGIKQLTALVPNLIDAINAKIQKIVG